MPQIEAILVQRLEAALTAWNIAFETMGKSSDTGMRGRSGSVSYRRTRRVSVGEEETPKAVQASASGLQLPVLQLPDTVHVVQLRNSVMYLDPPLHQVRVPEGRATHCACLP